MVVGELRRLPEPCVNCGKVDDAMISMWIKHNQLPFRLSPLYSTFAPSNSEVVADNFQSRLHVVHCWSYHTQEVCWETISSTSRTTVQGLVPRETDAPPRMPPEHRLLTTEERCCLGSPVASSHVMHWFSDCTENWSTPTSVVWSAARDNRKVHPTILAARKLMKCDACQANARCSLRLVVSRRLAELGSVPQTDKHLLEASHA